MNLIIRLAKQSDFDQVGNVFTDELSFHSQLLPDRLQLIEPIMTLEWYQEKLANPTMALLVAELEGQVVGVALVQLMSNPDDPIFRPRRYAYLDEIGVLAEHRGQGIGRRLVQAAQAWALEQDVKELELYVWEDNTGAIEFYERLGYRTFRRAMKKRL